jgi:hypothetical protein
MTAQGTTATPPTADRRVRCTHCGSAVASQVAHQGWVRGCLYLYCDTTCLELHAVAVDRWGAWCECGEEAAGDWTHCGEHLAGAGPAPEPARLAG